MAGFLEGYSALHENLIAAIQTHFAGLRLAAIALSICFLVYWVLVQPFLLFRRLGIPHIRPVIPPLGNLIDVIKGSRKLHMRCMREIGKVYGFYIGRRPVVAISDANLLEQVFVKQFGNFHNRPSFIGKKKSPMHLGMVIADYKDWRRLRLTVNPTFSAGKIKQMIPLIEEATDTLVSVMTEISKNEKITDLHRCYGRLTMDIILSVAFGLKTDFQTECNERVTEEAAKWFAVDPKPLLLDMLPFPMFVRQGLRLFLCPDPAYLVNLIKPVVEERKKVPSNRKDFLQLLLSENKSDGKAKLSDDDIYATAITFLLAGYETTSNALSYTTYLLALNPDIQERLYKEIAENFHDNADSLYNEVLKLDYLDQVLSESLRIYPPAFQTARLVEEDCDIGGYHIPKGTTISVPIYAIHHFEEYWKDHDKFDPERFNAENKPKINPFHYLPFGFGPRNCVGMRFALIEAKLTLVRVLTKFKFVQTAETEVPLQLSAGITMSPTNGIKLAIVPRQ